MFPFVKQKQIKNEKQKQNKNISNENAIYFCVIDSFPILIIFSIIHLQNENILDQATLVSVNYSIIIIYQCYHMCKCL